MSHDTDVLLGGRYKLTSRIATGGMGEVWAATDEVLGRKVAVKILRREYAADPTFHERFRAEARHTAALSHSGIAAIFDYSDGAPRGPGDDDHAPYLVMELVDGEPLSAVIARDGALSPDRAFDIIGQAANALQTAHDNGVIHRDVKPGNLLLTPKGAVKITDFGISRATNSAPLTRTGTIMGTAHYISPEQASGRSVTPASDIYSLGVVAYECLSGRRPFAGDTPVRVALAQVREEPPALDPDVPPEVSDLVMRMLAKDPAGRPPSAGALALEAQSVSRAAAAAARTAAPTRTLTPPPDPDETQAIGRPAALAATDTDPGFRLPDPRRTPRWVPYAVGLAVLGVLLLGVVRACTQDPGGTTTTTTSPSRQSAGSTSAAPPEAVRVRASEYLGQPVSQARAALRALGLSVVLRPVTANRSVAVGTVTGVDPTGRLSPDTTVTLDYARASAGDGKSKKPGKPKHDKKNGRG
jgi:eukaryotic-like serine/threonine-protein kinase